MGKPGPPGKVDLKKFWRYVLDHQSYVKAAEKFGITRARAKQIADRLGLHIRIVPKSASQIAQELKISEEEAAQLVNTEWREVHYLPTQKQREKGHIEFVIGAHKVFKSVEKVGKRARAKPLTKKRRKNQRAGNPVLTPEGPNALRVEAQPQGGVSPELPTEQSPDSGQERRLETVPPGLDE
jgi:hypothetical protein